MQSQASPLPVPQETQQQPSGQGADREKVLQAVLDRQKPAAKPKKAIRLNHVEEAKTATALASGLNAVRVENDSGRHMEFCFSKVHGPLLNIGSYVTTMMFLI